MSLTLTLSCSLATAALILIAGHSAQAASTTAKSSKSNTVASPDGIETVSANAGDISPTQSATSAIETNTVTPTNTSTAGLAKAIEAASPRKVFGEFYAETKDGMADVRVGKGTPEIDSYGGIKYDLGNSRALSFRQNFSYLSAGSTGLDTRGSGAVHLGDSVVNYTDGKVAKYLGDGSVIVIARAYLPTGESSRFVTHQAGKERLYVFLTKSYGKLDLTHTVLFQHFNWTQDSYIGPDGKEAQSPWLAGTYEFDAFYNFTPALSVGVAAGYDSALSRPLADKDVRDEDLYIQPTLQLIASKRVTTQLYLYNEINTRNPTNKFAFLRDDDKLQICANVAVSL